MPRRSIRVAPRLTARLHPLIEALADRRLLAAVTLDGSTTYQTIQGWGIAPIYPNDQVSVAQAGSIMRDAGMDTVRITAGVARTATTTLRHTDGKRKRTGSQGANEGCSDPTSISTAAPATGTSVPDIFEVYLQFSGV